MELVFILGLITIAIISLRISRNESIKRDKEIESDRKWKERARNEFH